MYCVFFCLYCCFFITCFGLWLIYPRKHYYSKCTWLRSVFIITSKAMRGQERDGGRLISFDFSRLFFFYCVVSFCFFRFVFESSKPSWKLYLVWAILSSVTLLYIVSERCNIMSTIKINTQIWRLVALFLFFFKSVISGSSSNCS